MVRDLVTQEVEKMMYCPQCGHDKLWELKHTAQSGRKRHKCAKCGTRTTKPLAEPPQILPKFKKQSRKRYIITQAVNDTPVVKPFLDTLRSMSESLDAQLVVLWGVYKNPDMVKQGFLTTLTWPSEVLDYICKKDFNIGKYLKVCGSTRIEHTAINPLNGMNHAAGTQSEIFGHPQLAMEMVATPKDEVPKMLITTGTVSQRNYGGSPKAKKASFHHNNSALLVETQGERFWVRPISWDGEKVQDLKTCYWPDGSTTEGTIAAGVYGDVHADCQRPDEQKSLLNLIDRLSANKNVLHDVLDMHTGSHHKEGDVLHNLRNPDHDVAGELDRTCEFIRKVPNAVIVSSNHHDHLDKWFNRVKPQREQVNLDIYYHLADLARRYPGSLFPIYCCESAGLECEFTDENEVYDICGIDVSQHGHIGPNGARGSGKSFAKTGRKTMTGHSHTPGITKGNWTVGTSAMYLGYAKGYSSWLEAHGLIYPSGKRTMLFRIKGKYSPMVESL